MSRLINPTNALGILQWADNEILLGQIQRVWADWSPYEAQAYYGTTDYVSEYFPAGVSGLLGNVSLDVGLYNPIPWGAFEIAGGITSGLAIIGVTRDAYGSPMDTCVVQLFLTSTDALVVEGTSDANGAFSLLSPFTGQHYIVAYKATAPDIFGTTVNTLVGA